MPDRRAANIAFALLLTVCLCGLAKRTVAAGPLQWHDRGHYREAKVNRPVGQASGFSLLSAKAAGVEFTNRLARARMVNANLLNGAGVAAGDVDGDGLCDLYLAASTATTGYSKISATGSSKTSPPRPGSARRGCRAPARLSVIWTVTAI